MVEAGVDNVKLDGVRIREIVDLDCPSEKLPLGPSVMNRGLTRDIVARGPHQSPYVIGAHVCGMFDAHPFRKYQLADRGACWDKC